MTGGTMSETHEETAPEIPWTLHYLGPGVQGEMNAREAGTSITAMADLVQAAAASGAWGDAPAPVVKLKPSESGSFVLVAAMQWAVAHSEDIQLLLEGAASIGIVIEWLRKHLRLTVTDFEHLPDRDTVKVTWSDGSAGELSQAQWKMYNAKAMHRALRMIAAPIDGKKITGVEITSGTAAAELHEADKSQLEEPDPSQDPPRVYTVWASPATVNFDSDDRWTIHTLDGDRTVTIEDGRFLRDTRASKVAFRSSDQLRVRMRCESRKNSDGTISRSYFVEEVIEYKEGAEQHELPSEEI